MKNEMDYTDWRLKGDCHVQDERWEEAVLAYKRSLDLNPGDSVSWREAAAAQRGLAGCREHFLPLAGALLICLKQAPKSASELAAAGRRYNAELPASRRATLRDCVEWLLSLNEAEFSARIRQAHPDASTLPPSLARRLLRQSLS